MKYFIIAGEASGDLHASNLMREIKLKDSKAEFRFSGGDLMTAQGGELLVHYRDMAFMGIVNVVLNASKILANFKIIRNSILQFQPDVVILVDYPSFNLRIARFVKSNTKSAVIYFIPPKLWAWKTYRIKIIKKYVDRVFTIFPFETTFYEKHKYPVKYTGNPLVDNILMDISKRNASLSDFCKENNLTGKPIIALLPGSRKQEIKGCLPRMIRATSEFNEYQVVICGAPGVEKDFYSGFSNKIPVIASKTYELLSVSTAAVVNSGTATLETALVGTPQVVVYHIPGLYFGYLLKKLVVKVKYISLVNLIAGKELIPELYAHRFTARNVHYALNAILYDTNYRNELLKGYSEIKSDLGSAGATERIASDLIEIIKKEPVLTDRLNKRF